MRWIVRIPMAAVLAVNLAGGAQTTGVAGGVSAGVAAPASGGAGTGQASVVDTRTEKQKELARQTERLFDMATELKVQVDKTNKNILSLKVVEKAEEIELMAKGMKEQAKR